MYFVYLLEISGIKGKNFYIGYSSDLKRRLQEHKNNLVKTTKFRDPKLIYYECYNEKSLAMTREKNLKNSGSAYNGLLKRLKLK